MQKKSGLHNEIKWQYAWKHLFSIIFGMFLLQRKEDRIDKKRIEEWRIDKRSIDERSIDERRNIKNNWAQDFV